MVTRRLIFCAALLTASCAHRSAAVRTAPPDVDADAESAEPGGLPANPEERAQYFQVRRTAVERLTATRALLGTATAAAASTVVNPQQWTFIGPQPMVNGANGVNPWAGSILSLTIDPRNSNTIYAVTYLGCLWKTSDGGTTWVPLSDAGPLVSIQWLAVDPANGAVYAMDSGLLYSSNNGGASWTELTAVPGDATCSGDAFAVHPSVSGTWLLSQYCTATNISVIYKTTNAGANWTKVATLTGEIQQFEFNHGAPSTVYAAGANGNAVLFEASANTGSTWTAAIGSGAAQLPQTAANALNTVRFASAPTSPQTIYLHTESSGTVMFVLYKSTDGGVTWNKTPYPAEGQGPRLPGVTSVDPTNANIVYAGALRIQRSTDGGATWAPIFSKGSPTEVHGDHHALIFSPDGSTAYSASDGGAWSARDFRTAADPTWTSLNTSLGNGEFEPPLGMDPTNINRSFGGLQDNSTIQYSGALGWTEVGLGGDGNGNAIDPQNVNTVYSVNDSRVYKSTAGGAAGTWVQTLPTASGGRLTMDFTTPSTLYYKLGSTLQQSLDGANTWPVIATFPVPNIVKVAVAPSTSNTVVVYGDAIPFVSNNAPAGVKATFQGRLPVSLAAWVAGAHSFVIDPSNPAKFYALEYGGSGSLLVSNDGGMSWQNKNLGPNVTDPPTDLAFDPDIPNTMYLGTESSVFRSSDGGATWWPLAAGFPIIQVTNLNVHHGARVLRVATAGRGAWDLAIPTTAPQVTGASLSGKVLTVTGANFTAGSAVLLNGTALTTSFTNTKQLTATVPAGTIAASIVYYVSVSVPGAAGGLSDPVIVSTGPTIYPNGVLNAASPVTVTNDASANSFAVGLAPGTFTAVYGAGFATATTVATAPYPNTLGGVKVLVNGTPAPIYFVSASQIDFVMPWEASGTQANIEVTTSTGASNTVTAAIQTAPQIFTTNQQGSGQAAVLIAGTGTIVAPTGAFPGSRPAAKGEYISIYATGLGAVTTQPSDGAPATGLSPSLATPAVNIGCQGASSITFCQAPVLFSGLAPGFVGLYQVNVQVPPTALSGSQVPLQLTFGSAVGRPSNIVTIAVQ